MRYALIGEKLGHSFSKVIHESFEDYEYEIKELSAGEFDKFMREKAFCGINITIPYKQTVMDYLDFIDADAKTVGAVNTVINNGGILYGYNTDFAALKMLIKKQGFDYTGKKVLILGSGGTAKTAYAVAKVMGAGEIVTVSRSGSINYKNVYCLHRDAAFIINTTPCGMYPDNETLSIDVSQFHCLEGVTDVVYNPIKTPLCIQCESLGIKAEGGLYMLVAQAVMAYGLFTAKQPDVDCEVQRIYRKIKADKMNIVLIGMPGSGKTTVGRILSKKTGRCFVDTDEIIMADYGNIAEIIKAEGEEYFRKIEAEVIKKVSKGNGLVIATGGGCVVKKENIDFLKQNSVLVFLNRPIETITPTADRPFSSTFTELKKRFEERYTIYSACCDFEIKVDGTAENTAEKILEMTQ